MKNLYSLVFALFLSINFWAQSPQKMSYQAVIRNTSNALITSSPVGMQISILQGSATGSVVYAETQTTITNANGLVSIEIGNGTVVTGTFSSINWANGPYFIKTETDPTGGTAYTISGTSELLSVPYALHAKTAESISGGITETDPAFTASPANGISSSDISNWNNKLSSEVDGSITNELQSLSISNDTVYLSNGGFAKLPAGFNGDYNSLTNKPTAVSSFSNDAGYLTSFTEVDGSVTNELQTLRISNDTVYLSNGGYAKLPAGFDGNYNSLTNKPTAVSSFSNDAGYLTSFTEVDGSVTNELQTLRISNDTIYLSNGGFAKLPSTNAWSLNGNNGTIDGTNFIGTTDNVALNFRVNNEKAGKIDISGRNTYLGYRSAFNNTSGLHNSSYGTYSFENNTGGSYNTIMGSYSYRYNSNGNFNTIIGSQAGENNINGSRNVFIGYAAGYSETGSNKLYIANDYPNPPLIYGDFATAKIGLGTITPTFKLEVTEDASFNGVRVGRGNGNISNNTSVGFNALNSNTSGTWNTALGEQALNANTTGYSNTGIGRYSLKSITTGNNNTAVGQSAMYVNSTGSNNSAYGVGSLLNQASGDGNTSIGTSNFYNKTSGNNNTALGMEAGFNNATGSNNVFIGYRAGYNETGSNKLYIANSSTTTPLIYGDFSNGRVGIGTSTPSKELTVKGDAQVQTKGTWTAGAKARLYLGEDDNIWIEHIHSLGLNLNTASGWKMTFMDGTDENMRIDGLGNVGIGTTTPSERLVVQGNHTDGRIATFQNAYDEKYITMGQVATDDGGYIKYKKSSNYTGIGVHGHSEQLIVNGSGNVGIGNTSPTAKLQVESYGFTSKTIWAINSMLFQNQTPGARTLLALAPNGTQNADLLIFHNSDYTTNFECLSFGYENTANYFNIATNKGGTATQRGLILDATSVASNLRKQFVLNPNGNVGIGTTNPTKSLHVTTTTDDWGARIDGYNTGGSAKGGVVIGSRADNKGAINGITSTLGPADLSINSEGGNVGIGTTAPTAKLEVNGAIKVTGGTASQFLKADGSLDNNAYLTAVVEVADEFSATAAQTSFTLTQTPSTNSKVKMYINGVRISNTAYSVSGTTLTYVPANNGSYVLSASDRIQFDYSY